MGKGKWPTWEESRRRREKAIELRLQGRSYKEIRSLVGGSSSSMSLWLRDVPIPPEHQHRIRKRSAEARKKTGAALHRRRLEKQARIRREAATEMGVVTQRDLFIAGVAIYAAEGSKQKPWQTGSNTVLINSDPRMILLFLRWLALLGIDRPSLTFRVAIHESADHSAAVSYWARLVGVPEDRFLRTTLKRGNPKTRRRNTGPRYRGCLVVGVKRSTDLTRRIDGWFEALVRGSARPTGEQLLGFPTPG
jgi:hypothetical protein